jgi:hypothetical protein
LDGVKVLDKQVSGVGSWPIGEVDLQPYIGGVGTHTGPTMDVMYGHFVMSIQ